jgi:hypothetical protein
VAVYNATDSIFSNACTTYTFKNIQVPQIQFSWLSDYPFSPGGWTAKAGDSIIAHELNAPAGKYTAINIKNPSNPSFAGYIDSASLCSYPESSLIPAFMKFGNDGNGIYNTSMFSKVRFLNNRIIVFHKDSTFRMYQKVNGQYVAQDSLRPHSFKHLVFLNDTTFIYDYTACPPDSSRVCNYFRLARFPSSGLHPYVDSLLDSSLCYMLRSSLKNASYRSFVYGCDSCKYILQSSISSSSNNMFVTIIKDNNCRQEIQLPGLHPERLDTINLPCYLKPGMPLCVSDTTIRNGLSSRVMFRLFVPGKSNMYTDASIDYDTSS